MEKYLNIPYISSSSSEKYHQFDIFVPENSAGQPLICFIHGGAWRKEDKSDHADTAYRLASFTSFPVAVPNYRLTPQTPTETDFLHHPAHAEDILRFLTFLNSKTDQFHEHWRTFDPNCLHLIGHSCGAHIISSIIQDTSRRFPSLTPALSILRSVKSIALSEGLYDLDKLLESFPRYREFFIENTFGSHHSYREFSVTSYPLRNQGTHIRWLILHSKGDTLVDKVQSVSFFEHLRVAHSCVSIDRATQVYSNMTDLEQEHNEIFEEASYTKIVGEFISADSSEQAVWTS